MADLVPYPVLVDLVSKIEEKVATALIPYEEQEVSQDSVFEEEAGQEERTINTRR